MEDENLLREVVGDDKNDKKRVANLNEENSDDEEVLLSQKNYIDSYVFKSKQSMHNLISFNSLRPWMNVEQETSPVILFFVRNNFNLIQWCDVTNFISRDNRNQSPV